jgi:hypothetical protein
LLGAGGAQPNGGQSDAAQNGSGPSGERCAAGDHDWMSHFVCSSFSVFAGCDATRRLWAAAVKKL